MNRTHVRSLLISSVALLPLLVATANAEPVNVASANPAAGASSGFVLYRPIAEALVQETDETDDAIVETDTFEIDGEEFVEPLIEFIPAPEPEPKDYSASLQDATQDRAQRTLDWRTPQAELRFDLSPSDITDTLSVTLSAEPLPGVDATIPLVLQFNGGTPIEIETRGESTHTLIDLDPKRIRDSGNVLRVSYATSCKAPVGGYTLNLDRSRLDLTARPKDGQPELRDVERRFASLTFAPQTVGLISSGTLATKSQALAAQGVGLRSDKIPKFATVQNQSDFDIFMLTRSELLEFTNDDAVLLSAGPLIAMSSTHAGRLFLTGDTEAEVLESVRAFATTSLLDSRVSMTTPETISSHNPLGLGQRLIDGSANLDVLTVQTGSQRDYVFDVTDPAASTGHLNLYLTRDDQTLSGARLKAQLNGVSLGEAAVKGKRKTVSYPIQKGLLLGTGNRLELTTQDANQRPRCGASVPFIAISEGSELRLAADVPTPPSDLSRFAADGSMFGQDGGAQTAMILPQDTSDFTSALSLVAKLAQASGHGWVDADFARGSADYSDRHLLIIEPYSDIEREFQIEAPFTLLSAWRGQTPVDARSDFVEKFASVDGESAVRQAALSIRSADVSQSNGVAAIYPVEDGRLVGVISNTVNSDFATAIEPLVNDRHWNALSGGVARWDNANIMMAQAALPMTTKPPVEQIIEPVAVSLSIGDRAKGFAANLPRFSVPRPDTTGVGRWIDQRWTRFTKKRQSDAPVELTSSDETVGTNPIEATITHVVKTTEPQVMAASEEASKTPQRPAITLPANLSADGLKPSVSGLQAQVGVIGTKASALRADLWRHLDIPEQDLKSARLGQAQIIPALLALTVIFLMLLVGMTFAKAPTGKPGRRK